MTDLDKLEGIKERELREMGPCAVCGKQLLEGPHAHPIFYRVQIEACGVDLKALERQQGVGMMLGHGGLAMVMGTDADMAKIISRSKKVLVHSHCCDDVRNLLTLIPDTEEDEG